MSHAKESVHLIGAARTHPASVAARVPAGCLSDVRHAGGGVAEAVRQGVAPLRAKRRGDDAVLLGARFVCLDEVYPLAGEIVRGFRKDESRLLGVPGAESQLLLDVVLFFDAIR